MRISLDDRRLVAIRGIRHAITSAPDVEYLAELGELEAWVSLVHSQVVHSASVSELSASVDEVIGGVVTISSLSGIGTEVVERGSGWSVQSRRGRYGDGATKRAMALVVLHVSLFIRDCCKAVGINDARDRFEAVLQQGVRL